MGKSNFMSRKVENEWFRGTTVSHPTTLYVALFESSAPPSDLGPGTEASYPGYGRPAVPCNTATWGAVDTPPDNKVPITVPGPTSGGPHPEVGFWALFDSASGGNMLIHAPLTQARVPTNGVDLVFAVSKLSHTED